MHLSKAKQGIDDMQRILALLRALEAEHTRKLGLSP